MSGVLEHGEVGEYLLWHSKGTEKPEISFTFLDFVNLIEKHNRVHVFEWDLRGDTINNPEAAWRNDALAKTGLSFELEIAPDYIGINVPLFATRSWFEKGIPNLQIGELHFDFGSELNRADDNFNRSFPTVTQAKIEKLARSFIAKLHGPWLSYPRGKEITAYAERAFQIDNSLQVNFDGISRYKIRVDVKDIGDRKYFPNHLYAAHGIVKEYFDNYPPDVEFEIFRAGEYYGEHEEKIIVLSGDELENSDDGDIKSLVQDTDYLIAQKKKREANKPRLRIPRKRPAEDSDEEDSDEDDRTQQKHYPEWYIQQIPEEQPDLKRGRFGFASMAAALNETKGDVMAAMRLLTLS